MLYQIDSQKVEDYLEFMEEKIEEMEENISLFETNKNKLDWEGEGAEAAIEACQSLINDERDFCNILRIYMLIYKKGLHSNILSLYSFDLKFFAFLHMLLIQVEFLCDVLFPF